MLLNFKHMYTSLQNIRIIINHKIIIISRERERERINYLNFNSYTFIRLLALNNFILSVTNEGISPSVKL